ncbi:PREDICTED: spermatogenesis- and oogenesis-specific basic helix-loop-helix-containing protein 1 isoform X1 [Colobus angolensis palliatus]|uniref:spermatogenesis- and oogenesis-specific basic helix-loop-helix-containing protein 1 isoform X1 n=1 Tax=Colobus angolensis palliatus TaxID=336983 RepID=UPI0005F54CAA|nr:PREDICTED: spermatogenesis- and oogenesis-specific basic helix-loop-helix-containing protein 1 isoform X1 [Colobus angolensis palliatus]
MASWCSEPDPEVSSVPTVRGCNGASLSGALSCCEGSAQSSGQPKAPTVADGPSSCLRRNVISERERRKRISLSCERLRALLPQFDGRREDMASVLEMSVQFLRLASALGPSQEQHAILASSKEMWHSLQEDVLELTLSSQVPAGVPHSGTGASGGNRTPDVKAFLERPWSRDPASAGPEPLPHVLASSRHWDPLSCTSLGTDKREVLSGLCQVRGGPPPFSEPSSLVPWPSGPSLPKAVRPPLSWPPFSQQQTLPMMSGEAPGWLGQAGPLAMGAVPLGEPAEEALMPVQEARSVLGSDGEDGTSFLLTAGPSWWPGFSVGESLPGSRPTGVLGLGLPGSLEGRGGSGPAWAPAESSPLDQGEPGFLGDPEPGFQELQDSSLEPWSLDVDCAGLALKDEVESIFPDFFAC